MCCELCPTPVAHCTVNAESSCAMSSGSQAGQIQNGNQVAANTTANGPSTLGAPRSLEEHRRLVVSTYRLFVFIKYII